MWVGERDGVLAVELAGRLEAAWAEEVRHTLGRHSPSVLSVDLTQLTQIDAGGLAALVDLRQDVVSGGGRFLLRRASRAVRAMLAAAGLDALVDDERDAEPAAAPGAAPSLKGDDGHQAGHEVGPVTHLPTKGGRDARGSTRTPKVA